MGINEGSADVVGTSWAPTGEVSATGPANGNPASATRDAVQELSARADRDPKTGRFVKGNQARGVALNRSQALVDLLADARQVLVAQVRADLGVNGDAAATLGGLVEAYAEARLLRAAMFQRMVETGGPVTNKGNKRAIFDAFLSALDRERRLALDLGLERRARRVPTVQEVMRGDA